MELGYKKNKLTYIEESNKRSGGSKYGIFKCECGNTKEMLLGHVRSGASTSCGCYHKSIISRTDGLGKEHNVFSTYKSRAKVRGYPFELTFEQFQEITKQDCFYCGKEPSNQHKDQRRQGDIYIYNGIDRLKNNQGYTLDNVVPCCIQCNQAKNKYDDDEFIAWIERCYFHLKKGGGS
jgi:hypothetical protein